MAGLAARFQLGWGCKSEEQAEFLYLLSRANLAGRGRRVLRLVKAGVSWGMLRGQGEQNGLHRLILASHAF